MIRLKTMKDENTKEFYESFYIKNRDALLQYNSLRKNFNAMVTDILGSDYYNMAMDVYEADKICCEDITKKAKQSAFERLFY